MADNLKLQQDINKLISERNKLLDEGEKTIQRQTQLYSAFLDVLSGKKGSDAIGEMIDKLDAVRKSMSDMADGAEKASEKTSNSFNITDKDMEKLFSSSQKLGNFMGKKFPKSFQIASAAVSGLWHGFKNIFAIGSGIFGVFSEITSGIYEVGKSILSLPFKILDGLVQTAQSGGGGNELLQAYEDIRKQFGSFKEDISNNVIAASRAMRGELGATGLSVWRVIGNLADRLRYVTELAAAMGPTFHILGMEVRERAEDIVAFQKGLGLSGEEMLAISNRTITFGKTLADQFTEVSNYSMQLGSAFGISSKVISRDIGKMIKDVSKYGSLSVKELSEISVYSRKLGVDFTNLQGITDKFDTFESAADSAAKLSQAFGVQINAFEIMKKQSPAEQIDDLKKAFKQAGVSAESFSRQESKVLEEITNLDAATVRSVFSSKNYGLTLDEVRKKSDAASKKQLSQTEIMNRLANSIERLTPSGGGGGITGFFDAFLKGITRGIQSSGPFIKLMMDIRRTLIQVTMAGVEFGRYFINNFPGISDIFKNIGASMKPISNFFRNLNGDLKKLTSGDITLESFVLKLQNNFNKFLDEEKGPFSGIVNGFKKILKKISPLIGEGIKFMIKSLTDGLKGATSFLKDPSKFFEQVSSNSKKGKGILSSFLEPIIQSVKDPKMWDGLWTAFKDFSATFWDQLLNKAILPLLSSAPRSFWYIVAGTLFAPSIVNIVASAGLSMMAAIFKVVFTFSKEASGIGTFFSEFGTTFIGASKNAFTSIANASKSLWPTLVSSITTIPTGAAAAGAAAIGASLAAIAAAGYAAYSAYDASDMQKSAQDNFTKIQLKIANASSKSASLEYKKTALENVDAMIKSNEAAIKDRGLGTSFVESLFGEKGNTLDDILAKAKRERMNLNSQIENLNSESIKKATESNNKQKLIDSLGPITVENAIEKFKKLDSLAKKVMSKDFDIADKMKSIQDKLQNIDFSLFKDSSKEEQLNKTVSDLESIKILFSSMTDIGILAKKSGDSLKNVDSFEKTLIMFDAILAKIKPILIGSFMDNIDIIASSSDIVGKKASSIDGLSNLFTSFANADKSLKMIQSNALSNAERMKITTSILELITNSNVVIGDINLMSTISDNQIEKLSSVKKMFVEISELGNTTREVSKIFMSAGIEKSFSAIVDIVKKVDETNETISAMTRKPFEIKARLQELATHLGMGSNQTYSIKNNGVEIKIDLQVTMDAGKVEEVIVKRQDSKIRKAFSETGLKDQQSLNKNLGNPY